MKTQNTPKLAKKTVFVFKNVKDQNSFVTNPVSDQSHTQMTSWIV